MKLVIKLFIPLQSIDGFCNHLQAMKNNSELHKDGKVFDSIECYNTLKSDGFESYFSGNPVCRIDHEAQKLTVPW